MGCGRLKLLLEVQVPLLLLSQDGLRVEVTAGDETPSGSRSVGGRQLFLEAQPEYNLDGSVAGALALHQGLCKLWNVVRAQRSSLDEAV